jgi:hypothetical protein
MNKNFIDELVNEAQYWEKKIAHIDKIIDIILNDCLIVEKNCDMQISELRKGFAHIQGLCNGIKRHINFKKEDDNL